MIITTELPSSYFPVGKHTDAFRQFLEAMLAKNLIGEKRFLPYFCTQFLGAFNDNIYRNAFAILITFFITKEGSEGVIVNAALVAFILPFFIFGAIAGQLADKYEKAKLIRYIKMAEIIIMLLGSLALYTQSLLFSNKRL